MQGAEEKNEEVYRVYDRGRILKVTQQFVHFSGTFLFFRTRSLTIPLLFTTLTAVNQQIL